MPSELYDLGLDAAVRQLVDEFKERTGWTVALALDFTGRDWSDAVKLNLYRIIQEALTNVEKHARAGRVELALQETSSGIELTIRDDGAGVAAGSDVSDGAPPRGDGMGLVDIRERVLSLGGTLSMKTAPGHGLKLVLTIPLPCP
jgi:two-component system NarL family sensor kinase